jgi:hypothetical protein
MSFKRRILLQPHASNENEGGGGGLLIIANHPPRQIIMIDQSEILSKQQSNHHIYCTLICWGELGFGECLSLNQVSSSHCNSCSFPLLDNPITQSYYGFSNGFKNKSKWITHPLQIIWWYFSFFLLCVSNYFNIVFQYLISITKTFYDCVIFNHVVLCANLVMHDQHLLVI